MPGERYLRFEDLAIFAKGVGKGHVANGLWRLIELYLHEPIENKNYPGLVLRDTQTKKRVTELTAGHVEVSLSSLRAARVVISEGMVKGYGRWTHSCSVPGWMRLSRVLR